MAKAAPSLEDHLERLESMDPDDRLAAIEELRRYAAHRKVTQAVFELRNDPDRRVRMAARELLEEADRRTSESLSVLGSESQERDLYINELLAALKAKDPTDRVTALKELRVLDDPRAIEAIEKLKTDSNRVVRMLAEEASTSRKDKIARPATSQFEGNVMVSSPVSERPKMDWREKKASRLGPELVPWIGLAYLATGLPFALLCLYLWMGRQGVFDPKQLGLLDAAWAPSALQYDFVKLRLGIPVDPLALALAFAIGGFQTLGGFGLLLRRDAGRKLILLFHAAFFLFGMLLPGLLSKFLPGAASVIIVYYLTRPQIVATFKGAAKLEQNAKPASYGDMERKVW
jgi:hypothetical protein